MFFGGAPIDFTGSSLRLWRILIFEQSQKYFTFALYIAKVKSEYINRDHEMGVNV